MTSLSKAALISRLVRLYPNAWRRRYEDEFRALLEDLPLDLDNLLDVIFEACMAHVQAWITRVRSTGDTEMMINRFRPISRRKFAVGLVLSAVMIPVCLGVRNVALHLSLQNNADARSLTAAVNQGDLTTATALLNRGASANSRTPWTQQSGLPPPFGSREYARRALFDPLWGHVPVLTLAAGRGNSAMVDLLLSHGADVDIPDNMGSTPLMWAVNHHDPQHEAIARSLIAHGANVNHRDMHSTPLIEAAIGGDPAIVAMLLQHGARPDVSSHGSTALMLAKDFHNTAAVALLSASTTQN